MSAVIHFTSSGDVDYECAETFPTPYSLRGCTSNEYSLCAVSSEHLESAVAAICAFDRFAPHVLGDLQDL